MKRLLFIGAFLLLSLSFLHASTLTLYKVSVLTQVSILHPVEDENGSVVAQVPVGVTARVQQISCEIDEDGNFRLNIDSSDNHWISEYLKSIVIQAEK